MTLEDAVFSVCANDQVVGPQVADAVIGPRIFPLVAPDETPVKYIVYKRVSGVPEYKLLGRAGLCTARLELDCWAKQYAEAKVFAGAVRTALENSVGLIGDSDYNVRICSALCLDDGRDNYDPTTKNFHTDLDFEITYQE